MAKNAAKARRAATAVLVAALALSGVPARANPDAGTDFQNITDWLSQELVKGIGFNAGEAFDPPHEVTDKRLQPDISLGLGHMPLDKSKFPVMQSAQIQDAHPEAVFPAAVNFPNLVVHLRGGLPWRMDFAIRGANMTTPPGYKLSPTTTAKGQSNSIGFTLRKHFLGGELPLVSLGAMVNHVYGNFAYKTFIPVNNSNFVDTIDINGSLKWNVNSYGLNAIVSQSFGRFTPFAGLGFNHVTGSINARLEADPEHDLIAPWAGNSSRQPEQNQGRVIVGSDYQSRGWLNVFFNAEVKAGGVDSGKAWIAQAGIALPLHIGTGSGSSYASSKPRARSQDDLVDAVRADQAPVRRVMKRSKPERRSAYPVATPAPTARKELFRGGSQRTADAAPTLIFIQ